MNQRDIEQLSEYLDGRLSPSDSARVDLRLASDPALASALDAMRETRALLRRMPRRRAPRNFLLTPKMVGRKPPLPRSYPVFKFATALAAFLFAVSFVATRTVQLTAASSPAPMGFGGGMGGGADGTVTEEASLAMEAAPAATEAPAIEAPALEPMSTQMALLPPGSTPESESEAESNRVVEDSARKFPGQSLPPLFTAWESAFAVAAILGALVMLLLRYLAARKWRTK